MSSVADNVVARDRAISDVLYVVQIACALGFGIAQLLAMLESVEGVSITWIALWLAFVLVNLVLAIAAWRAQPGRIIRQTVIIYAVWAVVCAANLAVLLAAGGTWNEVDSVTALLTAGGIGAAIIVARRRGLPATDPLVRATIAVFCKGVPQLTLAWNIWRYGGDGIAVFAFITGHLTITLRLWQVWYSIREAGWDRNRLGIAIGEAANEASWIVATVVWLVAG